MERSTGAGTYCLAVSCFLFQAVYAKTRQPVLMHQQEQNAERKPADDVLNGEMAEQVKGPEKPSQQRKAERNNQREPRKGLTHEMICGGRCERSMNSPSIRHCDPGESRGKQSSFYSYYGLRHFVPRNDGEG